MTIYEPYKIEKTANYDEDTKNITLKMNQIIEKMIVQEPNTMDLVPQSLEINMNNLRLLNNIIEEYKLKIDPSKNIIKEYFFIQKKIVNLLKNRKNS